MSENMAIKELKKILANKSQEVLAIEEKAKKAIHKNENEEEYRQLMLAKAQLLANLFKDSEAYIQKLDESAEKNRISESLQSFSQSAATSLDIDSVFFMSALLYPDDHEEGEPNNLEIFLNSL